MKTLFEELGFEIEVAERDQIDLIGHLNFWYLKVSRYNGPVIEQRRKYDPVTGTTQAFDYKSLNGEDQQALIRVFDDANVRPARITDLLGLPYGYMSNWKKRHSGKKY
jgi:hypothetical protein